MQIGRKPKRRGHVFSPGLGPHSTSRKLRASGIEFKGEQLSEQRGNMIASAVQIKPTSGAGAQRRLSQPWQDEAMAYYDGFGECRGPASFYADTFSQVRIFPAKITPGSTPKEDTESAQARDVLNRVRDSSGGLSSILASYGKLQFLLGDGYLACTGTGDTDEPETWEYLSPMELRLDSSGNFVRVKDANLEDQRPKRLIGGEPGASVGRDEIRCWRMWRRHPAHSLLSDSPMHSVLDLFEELGLLQAAVRARVKSRLASAGIFVLPEEITFDDESTEGEEDPEHDVFLDKLIEHMTTPIENEGTASAVTPFVLRGSYDYLDHIRHIKLHDPNETYRETGLRLETIKRIAIGLDIPPEILLGLGDSSHWAAWMVDEQVAKSHIYPLASMFCNDFASAYYRPALKDAGVADWMDRTVWYDATPIVVHPNRAQDAKDLYDKIELSGVALRKHTGFDEGDAPDDEERAERIEREQPARPQDPSEAIDQSSRTGDEGVGREEPQTQPQLQIVGAAQFALQRARKLAGARARRFAQGKPECEALIEGIDNSVVFATLGDLGASLGKTPKQLVEGVGDELSAAVRTMGVPESAAKVLGEQVEAYAARTLHQPTAPPLPEGFHALIGTLLA